MYVMTHLVYPRVGAFLPMGLLIDAFWFAGRRTGDPLRLERRENGREIRPFRWFELISEMDENYASCSEVGLRDSSVLFSWWMGKKPRKSDSRVLSWSYMRDVGTSSWYES